jgi:hypothetical protein
MAERGYKIIDQQGTYFITFAVVEWIGHPRLIYLQGQCMQIL